MRLGVAGREPVDQPRRVEAEVVVENRRGPGSVASAGTSRSVLGSSITTRGASSREASHVVTHGLAVPEALGVFQVEPEGEVVLDGERRLEPSARLVEGQLAAGRILADAQLGVGQGLVGQASSSSRVPSRARSCVSPGASTWAGSPVYSGADQPDRQRLQGGRRNDLDGDVADRGRIVAGGDREMERLIDRLDPPAELAPFDRAERLAGLFAVGEMIGRLRRFRDLVAAAEP